MNHSAESPRRLRCTCSQCRKARDMSEIVHLICGPLQACRLTKYKLMSSMISILEATLERHCLVQRRYVSSSVDCYHSSLCHAAETDQDPASLRRTVAYRHYQDYYPP